MWGYGYNMMGWGWLAGAVLVVLVVVAATFIYRLASRRTIEATAAPSLTGVSTPRQILDERYAKGEISAEEHLERVTHLDKM